ncbi:MAG TPA: carboxypeptidase-like regulatory domain-containing protein [Candidatus Acidoferrales bacterium]|nr:carboxypeptidase-like regulatory domain-containing protein [Candidatus Acidoferrales bacterium]
MQSGILSCALVVVLGTAHILLGQAMAGPTPQPATIMGTVEDTTGSVIPGATVVLQGPTANDQRSVTSRDNGFFEVKDVGAGIPYTVSVTAKGFANWQSNQIALRPGQTAILNGIRLRIATVQTTTEAVSQEVIAVQQERALESQRIIGFIPNFYVSYERNAVPLTPKLKFRLALKELTDPVTIAGFAMNAGFYQAADYPGYQQGMKGYGQRLGATFAGGYTNSLVGNAVLPTLLHQDPRYFFQGTGTKKSRLLHAMVFPFVTRTDSGGQAVNYSSIGGDIASGALANAYYPEHDRGAHLVVEGALIGAGGRMAYAIAQEFLLHKLTSKHGD